jgi:hypothetical protein
MNRQKPEQFASVSACVACGVGEGANQFTLPFGTLKKKISPEHRSGLSSIRKDPSVAVKDLSAIASARKSMSLSSCKKCLTYNDIPLLQDII